MCCLFVSCLLFFLKVFEFAFKINNFFHEIRNLLFVTKIVVKRSLIHMVVDILNAVPFYYVRYVAGTPAGRVLPQHPAGIVGTLPSANGTNGTSTTAAGGEAQTKPKDTRSKVEVAQQVAKDAVASRSGAVVGTVEPATLPGATAHPSSGVGH